MFNITMVQFVIANFNLLHNCKQKNINFMAPYAFLSA